MSGDEAARFAAALAQVRELLGPDHEALDQIVRDHPETAVKLLRAAAAVLQADLAGRQPGGSTVMVGGGFMLVDPQDEVELSPWVRRVADALGPVDLGDDWWRDVAGDVDLTAPRTFKLDRPEQEG